MADRKEEVRLKKVYLYGYSGSGLKPDVHLQKLKQRLDAIDAVLIDVRYTPYSRIPQFQSGYLQNFLGSRYETCKELGNQNYRGGEIKIVDMPSGIQNVLSHIRHQPVVLMCSCLSTLHCHRYEIENELIMLGVDTCDFSLDEKEQTKIEKSVPLQIGLFGELND